VIIPKYLKKRLSSNWRVDSCPITHLRCCSSPSSKSPSKSLVVKI